MGIFGQDIGRAARRPVAAPAPANPPAAPMPTPSAAPQDGRAELRIRRDRLAEEVTELHWDLGGLVYEMAIRDHFRLDVLVRRAAVLQERDAALAEVERLLRMEQDGAAGSCPHCSAPHSRGALFCWQCGAALMEPRPSSVLGEQDQSTAVMDALLAPHAAAPSALRLPPPKASALLVLVFLGFGVLLGGVAGSRVQDTLAASARPQLKVLLPAAGVAGRSMQ